MCWEMWVLPGRGIMAVSYHYTRGLLTQKGGNKPGLTAHTYNLSTQSVEVKGS